MGSSFWDCQILGAVIFQEHSLRLRFSGHGQALSGKALRQAELYGYLVARTDRLYNPGSNHPVCSVNMAEEMVRSRWLRLHEGRYEIALDGRHVLEHR